MSHKNESTHRAADFQAEQRDGLATDNKRGCVLPSIENDNCSNDEPQLSLQSKYSQKQLERARRTINHAEIWRRENPLAWYFITCHALALAKNKQPIAAQSLIESVRKKSLVDVFGGDTRTNNDYASVIARWLWLDNPQMRPYIELRKCAVGAVMGV